MARHRDKTTALAMRKKGMSYSEIKEKLGVSKSTLSYWLSDLPLSKQRINELRAYSQKRIERYRNTMREKREGRWRLVYKKAEIDLGQLSQREMLVAGFFLYWAEGGKTRKSGITLTNTDPSMIRFYLNWLRMLKVDKAKIKVRLHLYSDMDVQEATAFWSKTLKLEESHFVKPHIKKTLKSNISYRGFGQGTCNIIVDNRDISEYVLQGLKYISSKF